MKKMLATAQAMLGYDLLALCLEGPKEKLDDTVYSQVGAVLAVQRYGLQAVCKRWLGSAALHTSIATLP